MLENVITMSNFNLFINEEKILNDINLEIFSGETILLYGPRNSGKSALLRSFVHLNEELFNKVVGVGEIRFEDKDVRTIDKKLLRSLIIYSDTSFVENLNFLTLHEILQLSIGLKINEITTEHFDMLEKLNIAHYFSDLDMLKKYDNLSSWSMAEKISLITFISLARNPSVFMFDCILDHLDDFVLKDVKNLLLKIKEERTLIISTRNFSLFSDICDKVILLDKGSIKFHGSKDNFMINFPE
ncbi:ABC transporter ATP-binding protein [Tepiditoga spiralis]|uniref:ABC transporter ATP-binding protein n=1 Tax=Tepiditoga spiralis TaxID=2108365 RepID=A0A7G1G794_9BACT|nr:ATP-binding cassette domain-containing protein [Tepiditoga spiralis]BBE30797.1 ABC transporter ATP-binding protein [Tepiditoga spiralis]